MAALILPYKGRWPQIHSSVFLAETAVIIGDVVIGEESSIWYGCVIRGDVHEIRIGKRTNIQDGTVIHVTESHQGTYIGDDITVGHLALIHACTLESESLVGMRGCVMDKACVHTRSMVAAGSLVTPGKEVPTGQLWAGSPARFFRELYEEDHAILVEKARHYVEVSRRYMALQQST